MSLQRIGEVPEHSFPGPGILQGADLRNPQPFLEALPVAIYACDADGCVLWFNKRAQQLWGRSPRVGDPSELYCGSYKVFFNGREIARNATPMAQVLRTGVAIRGAEARVVRPDGSAIWAMVHIEPVRNDEGTIVGAINCFHETAGPPLDQERRLAATYEQAGIGIIEIDRDGKLLRANAHLRDLLQYSAEELSGASIFDLTHSEDVVTDREQFRRQVAGEIEGYTLEKRFRRADGQHIWACITSRSVRDPEGNFLYAVRVQQDITERKRTEGLIAKYSRDQGALHELTAQLQYAGSVEQVCSAAMDAMFSSLHCPRAAVLLFDRKGVMRFVAARGLSDSYMAAVEGHSPWRPDAREPEPICFNDVSSSDLPAQLKQTVLSEGIQATAFVPLQEGGRLLGKFMVYYDAPHCFAPSEMEMAATIARHVSFSLERLRAQQAAQHLAAIVESSSDAIVSKDLSGTVTSWNHGAERLFGYTAEEVIGKPITIVIPEDRLGEEPRILARIRAGERVDHFETIRRRKNGELIDVSLTISPIKDGAGTIIGASKIGRDISDRKAAEAKVRESERRLQDLLSAIPAAIYTTDAEGKITYYNEAAVQFAGRTPTVGSDEWCVSWKLYWPDGRPLPHDQCPMAIALKEGRAVRGVEAVAERPDGTRVPFIPYPTPLRDSRGKVVGAINMLVDISQRKEAETQQRVLLNELNHRVKNNMQMLQALLSSASRRAKSAEARQSLEDASARVSAIASAQRVLYGQTGAQQFDTAELLKAVCETARQTFPGSVEIVCDADHADLPNDVAMPLALILNELLTNAVKHGGRGGAAQCVRASLASAGTTVTLSVEDEGAGFEFEQIRRSASGLQLVEGLARQLGGKLTATATPRTRVRVEFPARPFA
jgi:PAS domain S-box-containing protein